MKFPTSGLYAITKTAHCSNEQVITDVTAALRGGISVLQYRDKRAVKQDRLAGELINLCHQARIPLIINDDIELAARIGADGVHLGRDDMDILQARKYLGRNSIIGISCYDSLERACEAEKLGATYVAFGRFFPSGSKPLATPAHIETLRNARQQLSLPVVAIGGILPGNGADLLQAGADLLAVIGGLFDHDPEQSARNYLSLFVD